MIKSVSVKNIALIDSLDFELGGNLNILSGETGAGKSLIIDALNFVLGERADRSLIRYGTDHAVVEALFEDYITPQVERYMEEVGIDPEEVLSISLPSLAKSYSLFPSICTAEYIGGICSISPTNFFKASSI